MGSNKSRFLLFIVFSIIAGVGCSQVNFSQSKHIDQSSFAQTPVPNATPTLTPLPSVIPSTTSVAYPSYAKIANAPYQYAQTEILINPQDDKITCEITAFMGPLEINLCFDVPDLCWTTPIATVNKTLDYTCAQAIRGEEILASRNDTACVATTQPLTAAELSQINDPQIYKVVSDSVDPSGAVPKPESVLPVLNTIMLDTSCRCHYASEDTPGFFYKYPALEAHCHSHFSDVYR